MTSPRIVIGVSCYNEAPYLFQTIPAILAQTMPDFRLVVLDNGSTDDSYAILRGFWQADARITLLRADRNLMPGRVANLVMHVGMTLWSDCRWFLAAGADDLMAPEYVEAVLDAAAANPEANLIFSPWEYINNALPPKRFPAFDPETCHAVHQVPAWSAITRELWDDAGPHDETMIAADWDWVVRSRRLIQPHQLDRPYIALRVREGGRLTQSAEVHWPTLHRRLCETVNKPVPDWAQGADEEC